MAQALSLPRWPKLWSSWGNVPLWLGYQVIQWGRGSRGAAIITPTPTWLMIAAYYVILILLFYPRRSSRPGPGRGWRGWLLMTAVALPLATGPQAMEVTCLDAYGGVEGVMVTPETGGWWALRRRPGGRPAPGGGRGRDNLHWRQFRRGPGHRLEPERGQRRGTAHPGPAVQRRVILVRAAGPGRPGLLGPRQLPGRPGRLAPFPGAGRPPAALGSVDLKYVKLAPEAGLALEVAYQGQRVLLISAGGRADG